jgi:hypothetical protein
MDLRTYLQSYLTRGEDGISGSMAFLNQIGLIEAIAKADGGQPVNIFPEGTRSRTIHLMPPKLGVGKAIYHAKDAVVIPIAHHGMHKVSPVGNWEMVPRPFHTVIINVGEPIPAHKFEFLRAGQPSIKTFGEITRIVMSGIKALRPFVLERYYGPEKAAEILREEAAFETETNPTRAWESSGREVHSMNTEVPFRTSQSRV